MSISKLQSLSLQFITDRSYFDRKIKDIKQYTIDEGKKVNDSLKAY